MIITILATPPLCVLHQQLLRLNQRLLSHNSVTKSFKAFPTLHIHIHDYDHDNGDDDNAAPPPKTAHFTSNLFSNQIPKILVCLGSKFWPPLFFGFSPKIHPFYDHDQFICFMFYVLCFMFYDHHQFIYLFVCFRSDNWSHKTHPKNHFLQRSKLD